MDEHNKEYRISTALTMSTNFVGFLEEFIKNKVTNILEIFLYVNIMILLHNTRFPCVIAISCQTLALQNYNLLVLVVQLFKYLFVIYYSVRTFRHELFSTIYPAFILRFRSLNISWSFSTFRNYFLFLCFWSKILIRQHRLSQFIAEVIVEKLSICFC